MLLQRLKTSTSLDEAWGPRCFSSESNEKFNLRVVLVCLQENMIDGCHERLWPPVLGSHTHRPGYKLGRLFSSDSSGNMKMTHMMKKPETLLACDFHIFRRLEIPMVAPGMCILFFKPVRYSEWFGVRRVLDLTWHETLSICDFRCHFLSPQGEGKKHVNSER